MTDTWLATLITETPQESFQLAITLNRRDVKYTQSDSELLHKLRPEYANDANSLTAAPVVIYRQSKEHKKGATHATSLIIPIDPIHFFQPMAHCAGRTDRTGIDRPDTARQR